MTLYMLESIDFANGIQVSSEYRR